MIPEFEAPGYLWNVVRDLTVALRAGRLDEAKSRVDEAVTRLTGVVYGEHLTRAQVRGVRSVAHLLGSGQIDLAMDLLEGELRNSFPVAPMPGPDTTGRIAP